MFLHTKNLIKKKPLLRTLTYKRKKWTPAYVHGPRGRGPHLIHGCVSIYFYGLH